MKEAALKDCIVTAPEMIATSFSSKPLIDSFVSSGMIDSPTKSCADLYGFIDALFVRSKHLPLALSWKCCQPNIFFRKFMNSVYIILFIIPVNNE